ncbi:hypothetical protein CEE36_01325 [candidate division TA06 bacterium B3_TA06]|uniref:DUF3160 domain-containing protein n=1 Tax=candidate division TA06 bacterium B3_TA06 TaxID=2012487 RepID=A0A532VB65_UNCT6|nr:MAG: hypothetical protein CEE36_01325 [candidate division TA06 bacterium B3_TA06]
MRSVAIFALTLTLGVNMTYAGRLKGFNPKEAQPELSYRLAEAEFTKIDSIGFVLQPTGYKTIYDVYSDYTESPQTPMFISADLCFHTLHLMVDYTVRIMEIEELLPKLEQLTAGMLQKAHKDWKRASGGLKEAVQAEYIYFAVGARLLGQEVELPKDIEKFVAKELARIEAHKGIQEIAFLPGVKEDYSQYVPRGHYTRSDDFRRYFKAMMWYGRLPLHVPKEGSDPVLPLQTALLLSMHLEGDVNLTQLWEEIYEPTAFFFGAAEDITPGLLLEEAREFFGKEVVADIIEDEIRMREFAAYLHKNIKPKILSEMAAFYPGQEPIEVPLSVRFMPQRFVPDSYIFTELVADRVTTYQGSRDPRPFTWGMTQLGPMRVFPRGLDVMAVLRWTEALKILKDEGDTEYTGYDEQFEKMVRWYASLSAAERRSSVYYRWFELFAAYKQSDAPAKADEEAWDRKKLTTALASWAELRHDAILYAKQSYTALGMAAPPGDEETPPPPLHLAVVEQASKLYAQMASCARTIAEFSANEDHDNPIRDTYLSFAETLNRLDTLARKQAYGEALTADEHEWLWNVAGRLSYMPRRLGEVVTGEADERMALVADVHTDVNTSQVLQEASGDPARLYVLVEIGGKLYVAQGGTYTYYEFKQPMADRLTDEAWQEMLGRGQAPAKPSWTNALFGR